MADRRWEIKIKKQALAYETGWQYLPGGEEAGSVLTDAFLEMAEENQKRYRRIWEKQELEFLKAVYEEPEEIRKLKGGLSVKASGQSHGKWLEAGTDVYTVLEQDRVIRFQTITPVQLTAAGLRYIIFQRGLCAWLVSDREKDEEKAAKIKVFQPEGQELAHPVFRWYFRGLCDGRERVSFTVQEKAGTKLPGSWLISDGKNTYPAEWQQTDMGCVLTAETPDFAGNLESGSYEVRLDISGEEELTEEWAEILCGGIMLTEAAKEDAEPEICLTDSGGCGEDAVLPFGRLPDEAACCYLACDRAVAGRSDECEIRLMFTEEFETEEKLPEPPSKEYKKLYKKYPWMQQTQEVREWRVQESVWEYFDGRRWRILPESADWRMGCVSQDAGERSFRWKRPRDMQPCIVEEEEHYYIRLRLESVRNAYAAYYRKYIPIWKKLRFAVGERRMQPYQKDVPDMSLMREVKMLLGFDAGITPDNRWYTGEKWISFTREQIGAGGKCVRYGREGFWLELREGEAENLSCLIPNYVEVLQLPGEEDAEVEALETGQDTRIRIPAETAFVVEAKGMGMLNAVSASELRYDSAGAPPLNKKAAAQHYFSHYGRLVTPMDMELLLMERYPYLRVESCLLQKEKTELWVTLRNVGVPGKEAGAFGVGEAELSEISEWLEAVIARMGTLWLRGIRVKCSVESAGEYGVERENTEDDEAVKSG